MATDYPQSFNAPLALLAESPALKAKKQFGEVRRICETILSQCRDSAAMNEALREMMALPKPAVPATPPQCSAESGRDIHSHGAAAGESGAFRICLAVGNQGRDETPSPALVRQIALARRSSRRQDSKRWLPIAASGNGGLRITAAALPRNGCEATASFPSAVPVWLLASRETLRKFTESIPEFLCVPQRQKEGAREAPRRLKTAAPLHAGALRAKASGSGKRRRRLALRGWKRLRAPG